MYIKYLGVFVLVLLACSPKIDCNLKPELQQQECWTLQAESDPLACEHVNDQFKCYKHVGTNAKELKVCQEIEDAVDQESCIVGYAIATKNLELCSTDYCKERIIAENRDN